MDIKLCLYRKNSVTGIAWRVSSDLLKCTRLNVGLCENVLWHSVWQLMETLQKCSCTYLIARGRKGYIKFGRFIYKMIFRNKNTLSAKNLV